MHLFNASLAFMLLAATHAFVVPKDTADGTYVAWTNSESVVVHERVDDFSAEALKMLFANIQTEAVRTLAKSAMQISELVSIRWAKVRRDGGDSVTCSGRRVWEADCDGANEGLDAFCGDNTDIPANGHVFTVGGVVVAYYCNYGDANKCSSGGRQKASAKITSACGTYMGGEDKLTNYALSYGYDVIGTEICGNVETEAT